MGIDYDAIAAAGGLGKGLPLSVAREQRKSTKGKNLKDAYAEVDARDESVCWVTGATTRAGAPDPRVRREHHHLQSRSTHPERRHDVTNIITTTALAHDLIERGLIVQEGVTTTKPVRFHWRPDVPSDQRVLVIRSRRRSQQRRNP